MSFMDQAIPSLSEAFVPPLVRGTADLTSFAYQGNGYDALMQRIRATSQPEAADAAWTYDAAIAAQLSFRRAEGLNLQDAALAASQIYRIARAGTSPGADTQAPLRLLALVGPGDLMTNTPLDFLTNYLNVRLDLLYLLPDRPLPSEIPDHDLAFFALGEADPSTLVRLRWLYATWPRPALNDPRFLPALERDTLSQSLAGIPSVCSPTAVAVHRTALDEHMSSGGPIEGLGPHPYPYLIRPHTSHAGFGAIPHHPFCHRGRRHQKDAIHWRRDILNPTVASPAFHLG